MNYSQLFIFTYYKDLQVYHNPMDEDSFSDEIEFDQQYSPILLTGNDWQNEKFIGQKAFKNLKLTQKVRQFFKDFQQGKTYKKDKFLNLFNFQKNVDSQKSVCAKPIERGQTIIQCFDCASDNSCIQCMECYKNSNHEGHKILIKKAYGGCCDCGDVQAWKKQGFCTKHTGQSKDIQIDQKEAQNYLTVMKQLFFLIFWQAIQQNTNNCKSFSKYLLQNLVYLNQKGLYYNKLTCMMFQSIIPSQLLVSKNVNNRSILTNLLSPRVAKHIYIDSWMALFFNMFQYYPFKKLLLSTYIKGFSIIYDNDEESSMRGSSISCQLLTSYQLVKQYAQDKFSIPLGMGINIQNISSFEDIFYTLYHDLRYITKLQGDTPQVYFKFHFTNRIGFLKLFQYRKIIKKQQDKHPNEPPVLQLAKYVKYFQIQFKLLQILAKTAKILQKDKQTLAFIIKTLYQQALLQENQKKMIIFKPLTRALTLFVFTYFDMDLEKINHLQSSKIFIQKVLQQSSQKFGLDLTRIFKICVQTYLFHSKILAQAGLNTTLYVYLYFYKIKNRFISSLDILGLKIFSMMHEWPQVNKQPTFTPQDYIWQSSIATTEQAKYEQLIKKTHHLQYILSQLNLVSASKSNQVYVAYQINKQCGLYKDYIQTILLKLLNQQKGNINLTSIKQFQQTFFHPSIDLANNYLKKYCNFDKNKKSFILNIQFQIEQKNKDSDSLNYMDFRCNLTNKVQFQSPQKTLNLMKNSYNLRVFDNVYSIQTIKKIIVKAIQLLKNIQSSTVSIQNQSNQTRKQKIKPLFGQLLKMIYLKDKVIKDHNQMNIIIQFLKKIDDLSQIIHPFYNTLLNPQPMSIQENQTIEAPQKMNEKTISAMSNQSDKMKKLKQKMQRKKKSIKQKYNKQLSTFEQEQKKKLQKEQIDLQKMQQQTSHKLSCIICKSQVQQNMVYLIKATYKNHQKLLGLGEGVLCLSVMSCYHPIDYQCYLKLQKAEQNKKKPYVKCPFCKFSTNTFLPVFAQSKLTVDALKRLQGALFMQKDFDQISVLEQVIKSFYHFSLLALLDPQRTLKVRLKVYKIVYQILKQNVKNYDIKKIYTKFIQSRMNLNPKVMDSQQSLNKVQKLIELRNLLQPYGFNDVELEELEEHQINHLWNVIQGGQQQQLNEDSSQSVNSSSSYHPNPISQAFNTIKNTVSQIIGSKSKNQKEQKPSKTTQIFNYTMKKLFHELNFQENSIICQQKVENLGQLQKQKIQIQTQQKEASPRKQSIYQAIQFCLNRLFDKTLSHHHIQTIYENLNDNNNYLKFRDLPLNFKPLGRLNKCQFCEQITSSMTLCLLCDWKGCLKNCLKKSDKKPKGAMQHIKEHGQQTLILLLSNCMIYHLGLQKSSSLGCIYKDQWGNDFNIKQEWQKFFLDEAQVMKMKIKFLHES